MAAPAVLAALERGELVRLMAAVDAGRLEPAALEEALEAYWQRHWLLRWAMDVMG